MSDIAYKDVRQGLQPVRQVAQVIQLRLPFGVTRLDKNLSLAPNATKSKGYWRCGSRAENELVKALVRSLKASHFFTGQRFHRKKHTEVMSVVLANLLNADIHSKQLLYSRSTNNDNEIWIRCIDFLVYEGLADTVITTPGNHGIQSWITANPELVMLLNVHKARIVFNKDKMPVVVRDKNGKEKPATKSRNDSIKMMRMAKPVIQHNSVWLDHAVTLDTKLVVPFLQRICNRSLSLGGRFYAGYQQTPSVDRGRFLFDGKETVELDYKSVHMAILYAWNGLTLDSDPYLVEGYPRDVVKAVTLRLVNTENLSNLQRSITISANPKNQEAATVYAYDREVFELRRSKGLSCKPPKKPKWLDSYIEGIPEGTKAEKLIGAFLDRHSAIAGDLGKPDIGLRLQAADSEVMAMCISMLCEQRVPVLPVHDSLICKATDRWLVKFTMQACFKEVFGHQITVK